MYFLNLNVIGFPMSDDDLITESNVFLSVYDSAWS